MISYIIIAILLVGLIIKTKKYLTLKKQYDTIIDGDFELNKLFHSLEGNFEHLKKYQNDQSNWYRSYCVGCYWGSIKAVLKCVISNEQLKEKLVRRYLPSLMLDRINFEHVGINAYDEILKNHNVLIKQIKLIYKTKKLNEIK